MLNKDKKNIFKGLINQLFKSGTFEYGVKLSSFEEQDLVEEIKNLKVIELDNLDDFNSYINYDYFLIFKFNEDYFFCDTKMIPSLGYDSLIKLIDYNHHLRKDKMMRINTK